MSFSINYRNRVSPTKLANGQSAMKVDAARHSEVPSGILVRRSEESTEELGWTTVESFVGSRITLSDEYAVWTDKNDKIVLEDGEPVTVPDGVMAENEITELRDIVGHRDSNGGLTSGFSYASSPGQDDVFYIVESRTYPER